MPLLPLALVSLMLNQSVDSDLAALTRDHVNVALRDWGYSHAMGSSEYGPLYTADRALDGRWGNRDGDKWNTKEGKGPHWLVVDLGHSFLIDAVVLRHEGVFWDGEIYNTSDFQVQRADSPNGPWMDLVAPVKGNQANISLLRFSPIKSRYLRFLTTKAEQYGNSYARLFEFEAYAPKGSLDLPLVKLAWPQIPQYRHTGGKLESLALVQTAHGLSPTELKVAGRKTKVENNQVWVPVDEKQPTLVSLASGAATWKVTDDRAWMAGLNGGAMHLVSSSHQDVAWIDTPDWCRVNRVAKILEPAIDIMNRDPRYRFTMENMLNLRELLQERPNRREEIARLIHTGQLEFGGTYNQPYESLLGGEQLIRQTYFGRRWLRKEFPGADTCIAYTVDVPGRSLQMQQILAKSGIRYLVTSRYHEGLFKWQSPDGSSILVYALPHYTNHSGVLKSNPDSAVLHLPSAVRTVSQDFAKQSIPPHYMVLNSTDFELPIDFAPLLKKWEAHPTVAIVDGKPIQTPTLDYSSTTALFQSLDQPGAKPVIRDGERPNMWLYIHGPTHHKAIQTQREAARLLPIAETFATMRSLVEGSFASYPAERLSNGWLESLYPDHGFGGKNGHITDGMFHAKYAAGLEAAQTTLAECLPALASKVKVDPSWGQPVVVFNPHSWVRSDVTSIEAPSEQGAWQVVDSEGKPVASQQSQAPASLNVATSAMGATVIESTGKGAERLLAADWWDARKGWWESSASPATPARVTVDLGQDRNVDRVVVRHYGSFGEFEKDEILNSRAFRVRGRSSLQSEWTTLGSETANESPISAFTLGGKQVRYIELEVTNPNAKIDTTTRELGLEVYATVKPTRPTVTFHAAQIPSLGYRTFYLVAKLAAVPPKAQAEGETIENGFYRIQLTSGGVASIYDKSAQRELLRKGGIAAGEVFTLKSEGNGAGEFGAVQQPTMEGFDQTSKHPVTWMKVEDRSGPVSSTYVATSKLGTTTVRQTLVVYHQIKRIDFDVDLEGWNGAKYREFRLAFPLGGAKAKVAYEVPFGTVRVGEDETKTTGGKAYGSLDYWQQCSDIHPREVQDFIRVQEGGFATTLSSSVSVFDYIDPTGLAGKGPLIQPILLASRRSCHGEGNWYIQPGDHHFHFSLTSGTASEPGWKAASDAQVALMPVMSSSSVGSLPTELSFAGFDSPNLRISTIKKAEDDDSVIVRCYDVDGKDVTSQLRFFKPFASATLCNLIEDEQKALATSKEGLPVKVGKYAIETVKLRS